MSPRVGFARAASVEDTRTSTIVVAASNSINPTLAPALYRCTGATDQVEIIAALTEAAAVGGEVVLLEGLYVTAAPIVFPGGSLALTGLGRATLIRPAGAAGNAITVTGRDDVIIRDLAIDTKTSGSGGHCIFIEDGSDRFRVENVWVVNSDMDGIHVEGTTITQGHIHRCHIQEIVNGRGIMVDMDGGNFIYRLHIEECDIGNAFSGGINVQPSGGNQYCHIINNVVYSCTWGGIEVSDMNYSIIQENICIDNGDIGISVIGSTHVQVLGNVCLNSTKAGISLGTSNSCGVVGNICQGNTEVGIDMGTVIDTLISGNICNENSYGGIRISQTSDHNTLTGNTCNKNVFWGIYLYDASFNTIVGNTCSGNDSGDTNTYDGITIKNGSHSNLVTGNQCQLNDRHGISVDTDSDNNKIHGNYLANNPGGDMAVLNVNCDHTEIVWNTIEDGAIGDVGTLTRASGNFDPSANTYIALIGAVPW